MSNDQEVKSPDKLELRGKPTTGVRFGKKAGFVVGTVVFTVLGLVLYGIATREPAGTVQEGADSQQLAPGKLTAAGTDAAGKIYAGVPDGVAAPKVEPQPVTPAAAPADAGGVPKAEPVPNLGGGQSAAAPATAGSQPPLTPEQQAAQQLKERREAERQKAMAAEAAVQNWGGNTGTVVQPQSSALNQLAAAAKGLQAGPLPLPQQGQGDGEDQNKQARKEAFLARAAMQPDTDYLKATVKEQISKYELKTTAVIPAVLITGINSDLPGDISAQVTDDIYDTATGRFLLIPKGTTIYGNYDSRVAFGQERVLVAWSRLQFPNGSTLNLEGMTGGDKGGYAGFNDQVNNHYGRLIGFGIGTALFSAAFQLSQPRETNNGQLSAQQTAAAAVGQQISQLGMQVTQRNLNIQPTLEIRPGYQFVVKVNKDVVFPKPYK